MSLVPAKCPQCGGTVVVDSALDAAICNHCGTPFIVEKAVTNYYVTNQIRADVVNIISSSNPSGFVIETGKLTKYNGASVEIAIPDSVYEIQEGIFKESLIESIVFPASIKDIPEELCCNCNKLKSVVIPDGVESIDTYAFYDCPNLVQIDIPDSIKRIGAYAFWNCNLLRKDIREKISNIYISNGQCADCGSSDFGILGLKCVQCGKKRV